jgi:hypothetical protein
LDAFNVAFFAPLEKMFDDLSLYGEMFSSSASETNPCRPPAYLEMSSAEARP